MLQSVDHLGQKLMISLGANLLSSRYCFHFKILCILNKIFKNNKYV